MAQFHHTAWTAKDGAPSQISALAQTADGYLWIGSARGLFRFDGVEFELYVPPPDVSLPSQNIYALQATPDGGLWISFRPFGLGFLKDGNMKVFSSPEESPKSEVFCLAYDLDGRIWAGTLKGLALFDGARWLEIGSDWNLTNQRIWSMFTDRDGTLWVAIGNTIAYLPRGSKSFQQTGIRTIGVTQITRGRDGRLWITEWEKFARTMPVANQEIAANSTEIQVKAYKLHFDREGSLSMIGSFMEGIKRLRFPEKLEKRKLAPDSIELESFSARDGLTDRTAGNILEDREGNIWISSTKGLNRFSRQKIIFVDMSEKPVYTFAKWRVKEGQLETVLSLLGELTAKSTAEEGNLSYEIHQRNSDSNTLVLFEGYKDESALAEHRNSEHFQALVVGKIIPLLEEREIVAATRL